MDICLVRRCCVAVLLAATASCSDPADFPDRPMSSLVVHGRITNDTGSPIAGARIDMSYNPLLCSIAARTRQDATTDSDGRYREVLVTVADDVGCVRIRASASGFLADSLARSDGEFRREPPFDSVETNFTLRRR